ncbi:MAG TPA: CRISPR-associated helicase Cas3' [Firmicutes bacterium]|nr:CRISPR-associated helicase Cas3' [Bacillota bacterium]
MSDYIAHFKENEVQTLQKHLQQTATLSSGFASNFGAEEWGRWMGHLHDIGKSSAAFQKKMRNLMEGKEDIKTDHSTAGAQLAEKLFPKGPGRIMAYGIAGHHSGLPNGDSTENSSLLSRLNKKTEPIPDEILASLVSEDLGTPPVIQGDTTGSSIAVFLFTRMLFSSLVDADYLDTENFIEPEKKQTRKVNTSVKKLSEIFFAKYKDFTQKADCSGINELRSEIFQKCLEKAEEEPGFFSLTVPTGGGKTLSSLGFALRHAIKYQKKRVIYVIPYTSIIEQNADVFRRFVGDKGIVEHHSNMTTHFNDDDDTGYHKLATENWDAPLILTTSVQFFESLFSYRPSQSRKIHNIAESVIIFDEIQTLPLPFLEPSLAIMRELRRKYGTSILFCTATQPGFDKNPEKVIITGIREILDDKELTFRQLQRVSAEYLGKKQNSEVAELVSQHDQCLVITDQRKAAKEIFEKFPLQSNIFHLSTYLCPQHRSVILQKIKELLKESKPCWVVSTQLIEAGVDIDFPVVYRSLAGIDSLAQAAGRCNREGRLEKGLFFVYKPFDGVPPISDFRVRAEEAEMILRKYDDFLSPQAIDDYFEALFWRKKGKLDSYGILEKIKNGLVNECLFPFREISSDFQFINDNKMTVYVPFDEISRKLIEKLPFIKGSMRGYLRMLQRFTVGLYERHFFDLKNEGFIDEIKEGVFVLNDWGMKNAYDEKLGLYPKEEYDYKAETMIW